MVEEQLRARGLQSESVLEAMGMIPRELFLPPTQRHQAYKDRALPLSQGQTISQPFMVAVMTEALDLDPSFRVLEIGTGSGYQTAILAHLVAEVFSMERIPELASQAEDALDALGCENVRIRVADGTLGWPDEAPFDGILVTAGAPHIPESLKDQLIEDGGRLVVPVGNQHTQELIKLFRDDQNILQTNLGGCRFVKLIGKHGWKEA